MKFTSLILILCLLLACRDKSKIPTGILPKDKMEKVIWDMMLADRFASQFITKDTAKKNLTEETFKAYAQVFSIHNISREEFVKSYKFYMTRPDLSRDIMDTILQRSNRLKEENYKPRMANPPDSMPKVVDSVRRDSLK